jgi:hypothetical protein
MHILYDLHSQKLLATGDLADVIRIAGRVTPFGAPTLPGQLEELQTRIDHLEDFLAYVLSHLKLDTINAILREKELVVYEDESQPES